MPHPSTPKNRNFPIPARRASPPPLLTFADMSTPCRKHKWPEREQLILARRHPTASLASTSFPLSPSRKIALFEHHRFLLARTFNAPHTCQSLANPSGPMALHRKTIITGKVFIALGRFLDASLFPYLGAKQLLHRPLKKNIAKLMYCGETQFIAEFSAL